MTTCTHSHTESGTCPVCRFEPFSRNHYFDGKFMVARDFTDEQRYYVDKLRHHHARLHGWGVVCGLKVKQHPNEACRDRFVCIEPGSAIDCCGREIILAEEECIDITTLPAIKALREKNDEATHSLQICVRYRECPTEDVPVLYDECGCDETKCSPNRILESYEFDVIVDPEPERALLHTPRLTWEHTLNLAHARRVVVHEASKRLYVLNEDTPGVVYQLDTATHATITSHTLSAKGVAVAISNNGERLYLIAEGSSETENNQLYTLDVTQPGLPMLSDPLEIAGSAGNDVVLIVEPGGSLLALVTNNGTLRRWAVNEDLKPTTSTELAILGVGFTSMALSSDGAVAYVAGSSSSIRSVTIETGTQRSISDILPTGAQVSALALVKSTGSDLLAVVDKDRPEFHLVPLNPATVVRTVSLDHPPVALTVSSGGCWAYVLEQDEEANESYVQAVNVHALQQNLPTEATPQFKVSHPAQQVILDASGQRLYIPFTGEQDQATSGGVAIVDLSEEACKEILWRHLESCLHCDIPNCVVVATIPEYKPGIKIQDGAIDNKRDRRVLASTEVLQEWIECLSRQSSGGIGTVGGQGPPGEPGKSVKSASAVSVAPTASAVADFNPETGHIRFEIPKGEKGDPGGSVPGPGLESGLTQIIGTSWEHGTRGMPKDPTISMPGFAYVNVRREFHSDLYAGDDIDLSKIKDSNFGVPGLVIAFSNPVNVYKEEWTERNKPPVVLIDSVRIFEVKTRTPPLSGAPLHWTTTPNRVWPGRVIPVKWKPQPGDSSDIDWTTIQETSDSSASGIAMLFSYQQLMSLGNELMLGPDLELWITLRGDFVLDENQRAIDAEYVRARLPTGDRPAGSHYGIQGGVFESWFWPLPIDKTSVILDIKKQVVPAALSFLPGATQSLISRITAAQQQKPFASIADFRKRANIAETEWDILKDHISVEKSVEE